MSQVSQWHRQKSRRKYSLTLALLCLLKTLATLDNTFRYRSHLSICLSVRPVTVHIAYWPVVRHLSQLWFLEKIKQACGPGNFEMKTRVDSKVIKLWKNTSVTSVPSAHHKNKIHPKLMAEEHTDIKLFWGPFLTCWMFRLFDADSSPGKSS